MNARTDGLPKERTKRYHGKCGWCSCEIVRTRSDGCLTLCTKCRNKVATIEQQTNGKKYEYYSAHKEQHRLTNLAWGKLNRAYKAAAWAEYYCAKMKRTPPWSDLKAIKAIYQLASEMSELTGMKHHVDHVIPLRSQLVSGLHVPANLQVITAQENLVKNDSFEPYLQILREAV